MIPKAEDVLREKGILFTDFISSSHHGAVSEAMKEYGRRLLDHVANKCTDDWGNGFTLIEQDEILKIKDEL